MKLADSSRQEQENPWQKSRCAFLMGKTGDLKKTRQKDTRKNNIKNQRKKGL